MMGGHVMRAVGWIALGLLSCASMRVEWERDPAVSLSACETYAWVSTPSEAPERWRDTLPLALR